MTELQKRLSQMNLLMHAEQVDKLEKVIDEHLKWNRKINLSAFLTEQAIVDYQIIDSLTLLQTDLNQHSELLDIGTGPGFPGLPLAIVCPALQVILCDSNTKKLAFATHLIGQLKLTNVQVMPVRVENIASQRFSQITARAFSRLDAMMSQTARLLASSGALYAMKSQSVTDEVHEARSKFPTASVEITPVHHVIPEMRVIAKVTGYSA